MRRLSFPQTVLWTLLVLATSFGVAACKDGGGGTTTPPTPTISVALSSSTLDLTQGQNNTVTVNVTRGGGFNGAVDLSLEGAPAGVSGTFAPASVPAGSTSSTLTLNADMAAAVGAHNLTVRARGQGVEEKTASLALTVAEAPSISLAVEPAALSVTQATSGNVVVTIARTNFPGAVDLSLEGAPAGVSGTFEPASLTGGATTSTLTLTAAADAAIGASELVIRAQGQGVEARTAAVALTVQPTPAISVAVEPAALTLNQGASGGVVVNVGRTNFGGAIELSLEGAPAGVTGTFAPSPIPPEADAGTLSLAIGAEAPVGTSELVIRARGEGVEDRTAALALTINPAPAYTLTLEPTSLSIEQGGSGTAQIQLARTNFAGAVALSVSGAPSGVTASVSPASVTENAATLTVEVGAATAPGNHTLTVTGQAQGLENRTVELALTITAAAAYTMTLNPTSLSVEQGGSGTAQIQLARTNFTGAVALSVSGAPSGVTASVSPASTTDDAATLTVSVGSGVAPGSHTLTITGQAEGLENRTATLELTITQAQPGSFSLSVTPPTVNMQQGQSGTATVNINRTGGFTGAVALSISGAPSGLTATLDPPSTTGLSATVNLEAAANLAPGNYPLTIRGSGEVAPGQTHEDEVTLTATVTRAIGDCPGPLTNGENHHCAITTPGQLHNWTFTAAQGDFVTLSMSRVEPFDADFRPWIRLISPTGAVVSSSSGTVAQITVNNLPANGTYTVIAASGTFSANINSTGNYLLRLAKVPGAFVVPEGDHGGPLTNGQNHPGFISLGDLDMWTFTAAQGDFVTLSMSREAPFDASFNPWIRLISPTGAVLRNQTGTVAQVSLTIPANGTYTVIAASGTFSANINATGNYLLQYSRVGAGAQLDRGREFDHQPLVVLASVNWWSAVEAASEADRGRNGDGEPFTSGLGVHGHLGTGSTTRFSTAVRLADPREGIPAPGGVRRAHSGKPGFEGRSTPRVATLRKGGRAT